MQSGVRILITRESDREVMEIVWYAAINRRFTSLGLMHVNLDASYRRRMNADYV